MLKRLLSVTITVALVFFAFSLPIFSTNETIAYDNIFVNIEDIDRENKSNTSLSASDTEVILTRNKDGSVTQRTMSTMQSIAHISSIDSELLNSNTTALSTHITNRGATSLDSHGRTIVSPTENRVGQIACRFNTDSDPEIDITYFGTASLQHYDVLVSCAHCVWKPQFASLPSDGWASEVTFYAGRTDEYSYVDSADEVSISISQSFVNNSYFTYNDKGEPVAIYDFNWDWSIIQIDKNLGGNYGWFGLHGCGEPEANVSIYTIGYPGDKEFGTQWKSTGTINSFDGNRMYYDAYIYDGNSGSPILNGGYLYGIATFSTGSKTVPWISSGGTRMYPNLFNLIVSEREESAERWGT